MIISSNGERALLHCKYGTVRIPYTHKSLANLVYSILLGALVMNADAIVQSSGKSVADIPL